MFSFRIIWFQQPYKFIFVSICCYCLCIFELYIKNFVFSAFLLLFSKLHRNEQFFLWYVRILKPKIPLSGVRLSKQLKSCNYTIRNTSVIFLTISELFSTMIIMVWSIKIICNIFCASPASTPPRCDIFSHADHGLSLICFELLNDLARKFFWSHLIFYQTFPVCNSFIFISLLPILATLSLFLTNTLLLNHNPLSNSS